MSLHQVSSTPMLTRITKGASLSSAALCLLAFFTLAQSNEDEPAGDSATSGVEFHCSGGEKFTIRFLGPETITLDFMGDQHELPRERAASGVKYGAEGVTFWNKGDTAMVEIDGVKYSCETSG